MDDCIFCKIVRSEIPSYKVMEDDAHLAFLTIEPFAEGHTLVVPKKHTNYLFDMEDDDLSALSLFSKQIARILKLAFNPGSEKIGVLVAGNEVPHTHLHLVPFAYTSELSFASARHAAKADLEKALEKIETVL